MNFSNKYPSEGEIEEAKKIPNGWVYRIHPYFNAIDRVPEWAIIGAWKVNELGLIIDELIPNPNFDESLCLRIK